MKNPPRCVPADGTTAAVRPGDFARLAGSSVLKTLHRFCFFGVSSTARPKRPHGADTHLSNEIGVIKLQICQSLTPKLVQVPGARGRVTANDQKLD
jgi:hypothetical protein